MKGLGNGTVVSPSIPLWTSGAPIGTRLTSCKWVVMAVMVVVGGWMVSHAGVGSAHLAKFRATTSKLENIKIVPHFKEHYYIRIAFNGISKKPKY